MVACSSRTSNKDFADQLAGILATEATEKVAKNLPLTKAEGKKKVVNTQGVKTVAELECDKKAAEKKNEEITKKNIEIEKENIIVKKK